MSQVHEAAGADKGNTRKGSILSVQIFLLP